MIRWPEFILYYAEKVVVKNSFYFNSDCCDIKDTPLAQYALSLAAQRTAKVEESGRHMQGLGAKPHARFVILSGLLIQRSVCPAIYRTNDMAVE